MSPGSFRFERFSLDVDDRQLRLAGEPVEVNGRYFDALALLVRERGRLVSKDRFLEEVWSGIPVTDDRLVGSAAEAARAAADIGFPVVMKVSSPDLLHKSDLGLVEVGLGSAAEVKRALWPCWVAK